MAYKGSLESLLPGAPGSGIQVKIHMRTLFLAIWLISGNDPSPWYLCSLLMFSSGGHLLRRAAVRRDRGDVVRAEAGPQHPHQLDTHSFMGMLLLQITAVKKQVEIQGSSSHGCRSITNTRKSQFLLKDSWIKKSLWII